jgi:hypothetical protein
MTKPLRAVLPLLKAPITDFGPNHITLAIGAQYGAPTTIRIVVPSTEFYDLRNGDMLSVYTEVLLKGSTDAQPQ